MSLETQIEADISTVLPFRPTSVNYMAVETKDGTLYRDRDSHEDVAQLPTIKRYLEVYQQGAGKEFFAYLQQQGLEPKLDGVGSHALPQRTVAAIASQDGVNIFLANRNFEGKIRQFAETYARYGLTLKDAAEYVLHHEMVHASGIQNEEGVEGVLAQYFMQKAEEAEKKGGNAQKYQRMAQLAQHRLAQGEERLQGKDHHNTSNADKRYQPSQRPVYQKAA